MFKKFTRKKVSFERIIFFHKHFRSLAGKFWTLGVMFAIIFSRLHSTCPEVVFGTNVYFSEKIGKPSSSFETLSETSSDFFRIFSYRFVKHPFCIKRRFFFNERDFFSNWFNFSVRLLIINFWQAYEHLNFWCPMEVLGLIFFPELVFLNSLSNSEPSNMGHLASKLEEGLLKLHLLVQWNLARTVFLKKPIVLGKNVFP